MGLSTGKLVENLLASLELRLERAYAAAKVDPDQVSEKSDKLMIEAILIGDDKGWSDNWENKNMAQYLSFVRKDILYDVSHTPKWKPVIRLLTTIWKKKSSSFRHCLKLSLVCLQITSLSLVNARSAS